MRFFGLSSPALAALLTLVTPARRSCRGDGLGRRRPCRGAADHRGRGDRVGGDGRGGDRNQAGAGLAHLLALAGRRRHTAQRRLGGVGQFGAGGIAWPAPQRYSLQGFETAAYQDHVVLPVALTLAHPGRPLALHAAVDYAACAQICVPYSAKLALLLPAGAASPAPQAGLIAAALARVPKSLAAAGLELLSANAAGSGKDTSLVVRLRAGGTAFQAPDLFVEGLTRRLAGPPRGRAFRRRAGGASDGADPRRRCRRHRRQEADLDLGRRRQSRRVRRHPAFRPAATGQCRAAAADPRHRPLGRPHPERDAVRAAGAVDEAAVGRRAMPGPTEGGCGSGC